MHSVHANSAPIFLWKSKSLVRKCKYGPKCISAHINLPFGVDLIFCSCLLVFLVILLFCRFVGIITILVGFVEWNMFEKLYIYIYIKGNGYIDMCVASHLHGSQEKRYVHDSMLTSIISCIKKYIFFFIIIYDWLKTGRGSSNISIFPPLKCCQIPFVTF